MSEIKIIKFEKPNCAPCVAVSTMLDQANIPHEKINYIAAIDVAQSMGVRTVPTVFATREIDGKQVVEHQVRGANPEEISSFISQVAKYYTTEIEHEKH